MGWQVGFDIKWNRDIGYGVPAICDFPGCGAGIDRGLAYVCGGDPYGGEHGCGLFFCGNHMTLGGPRQQCVRCANEQPPFEPTPDTAEWIAWKLADDSWGPWRDENPEAVAAMRRQLAGAMSDIARSGPSVLDCLETAMRADPSLTIERAITTVPIAPRVTMRGCCDLGVVPVNGCNCGSPADASVGYAHEPLCGWEQCPNGCWEQLHPPHGQTSPT